MSVKFIQSGPGKAYNIYKFCMIPTEEEKAKILESYTSHRVKIVDEKWYNGVYQVKVLVADDVWLEPKEE